MNRDHSRAPVLEAIAAYRDRGGLAFTPPGHKQGRGADPRVVELLGEAAFAADLLTLNGLDDRRLSRGVLTEAQGLMADAVGAEHTFFSTCGSSLSVKSAMLAVAGPHERILVSRNAHKSVIAGLIISGVCPIWVRPRYDPELFLAHPPGPEEVRAALAEAPEAKGMLLITPTDYGTCADIRKVAEICHQNDRPLIVDEAWGAHFPFHDKLPTWAMDAGADLCVTSTHKMGGGLEQASVFHLQGDRVPADVLKARADLLGTTSTSALLFASLDAWRRQMVEQGAELLETALAHAATVRAAVDETEGLRALGEEFLGPKLAFEHDFLKIVIDVAGLGITGYQAADRLAEQHIHVGLSDHRRIAAQITHADDEETVAALIRALRDLAARPEAAGRTREVELPAPDELILEMRMLPRDAFFAHAEHVPLEKATGRVSAEMISPYPPGVPVVAPGEVITEPIVRYLRSGLEAGMFLYDTADPELRTVRVVT
ncbi:aminotransferase class I/II-fold pyridoxal phosphate-dependent enzyme [Amycolatopsis anabasis]|uniref:aminotransferase class I/II-fold pyridoxal phosphate-dependent enzyme n=1 Tax=Amycolatopsis anabasis TaxID=1840409 RepID=UPI00131C6C8C|nr:ornithine decarboxylase [Amycolatopsis anabasis]